jgi:altronate dehydratase small subunit
LAPRLEDCSRQFARNGGYQEEGMSGETDPRLLLLSAADNVLVATTSLPGGTAVLVDGTRLLLGSDLQLGHKLAPRAISAGQKIIKYGAPIGVATVAIEAGAHVHVHNVRSDYTPTHHLEDSRLATEKRP